MVRNLRGGGQRPLACRRHRLQRRGGRRRRSGIRGGLLCQGAARASADFRPLRLRPHGRQQQHQRRVKSNCLRCWPCMSPAQPVASSASRPCDLARKLRWSVSSQIPMESLGLHRRIATQTEGRWRLGLSQCKCKVSGRSSYSFLDPIFWALSGPTKQKTRTTYSTRTKRITTTI